MIQVEEQQAARWSEHEERRRWRLEEWFVEEYATRGGQSMPVEELRELVEEFLGRWEGGS